MPALSWQGLWGPLSPQSSELYSLLAGHCWLERGLLYKPSNLPSKATLIRWHFRSLFWLLLGRVSFWFWKLERKMAAYAFFFCRLLAPWAPCALSVCVRGWRNVLASPLPSCYELPGRMGPIVGCACRHRPPRQCQVCCGLCPVCCGYWVLRAQQTVPSFHASLPFRTVLRDGPCALFASRSALFCRVLINILEDPFAGLSSRLQQLWGHIWRSRPAAPKGGLVLGHRRLGTPSRPFLCLESSGKHRINLFVNESIFKNLFWPSIISPWSWKILVLALISCRTRLRWNARILFPR